MGILAITFANSGHNIPICVAKQSICGEFMCFRASVAPPPRPAYFAWHLFSLFYSSSSSSIRYLLFSGSSYWPLLTAQRKKSHAAIPAQRLRTINRRVLHIACPAALQVSILCSGKTTPVAVPYSTGPRNTPDVLLRLGSQPPRRRREFATTVSELNTMAPAETMGWSLPAMANGMATTL